MIQRSKSYILEWKARKGKQPRIYNESKQTKHAAIVKSCQSFDQQPFTTSHMEEAIFHNFKEILVHAGR
jgi:hypothetical protein